MVNGFQPISACAVSCLFYDNNNNFIIYLFVQVCLILRGGDNISDPIELKCAGKPLFQRSSCDVFVVR